VRSDKTILLGPVKKGLEISISNIFCDSVGATGAERADCLPRSSRSLCFWLFLDCSAIWFLACSSLSFLKFSAFLKLYGSSELQSPVKVSRISGSSDLPTIVY